VQVRARERRPDPTFGVRGGVDGTEPLVGLSFSIPLYVRNDFRAEVEQANAERIRAEQELAERMRRARAALVSALERYRLARGAWRLWTESGVPSIEKQVRLLDRVWRAGEIGTTDYLVQVDQTLATRADALEARGRLWRSWFDWLEASDGFARWFGWESAPAGSGASLEE
jgi:cobalt-zinc-cadmium efflux system outer membrane protein